MKREQLKFKIARIVVLPSLFLQPSRQGSLERDITEGENPVWRGGFVQETLDESVCLGMQTKRGGKYHLKLNSGERPIANKYREGKMKRTLKRELKST